MYGKTNLAPSINSPVDGFGYLLGFALLKELCWVVVVVYDLVKGIHYFFKEFRCRTDLSSSVDEVVDKR